MKVIHFIASIDRSAGGTASFVKLLASELNHVIDLTIVTSISENPINIPGVKIKFFDIKLSRCFFLQKEFYNLLKVENPDLVHINGVWNPENWLFQKASIKLGIDVLISPHGMLDPYIMQRNKLKKKIALKLYQSKALRKCDFFHVTSGLESDNLIKFGLSQPIISIPNGIELKDFPKIIPIKSTNPKKLLFLSRIHEQKGIELLIDAWSSIPTEFKDRWRLEIVGNGEVDYVRCLKKRISVLGAEDSIRIKPAIYGTEKINAFREASLFVLPSFSECFGIVVTEALASYTPVLTTQGTPWEELESKNCGWWIDLSVDNLQNTLKEAIQKSEHSLINMGENGRKLIEEKYDIKMVAGRIKGLYKRIITENIS